MPKSKRAAQRKPGEPSPRDNVEKEELLIQQLVDLAIGLAGQGNSASMTDSLKQKAAEFHKLIRKGLLQKNDELLYESLERAKDDDGNAYQMLKDSIEDASEIVLIRSDEGSMLEVNAFVIPMFVRTTGGLRREQCFQDQEAFDLLSKSFKEAQLESRDATVVLVGHAYHRDEIERITYSQLNEMTREAFASMTRKKIAATPAIDRSFSGWPENHFASGDLAVELRFLLGFALKAADDAFYRVPEQEAAADAYFDVRKERFQRWTEQAAPLVQRCLVADDAGFEVDFLYQDLFHGGKERGIAEYFMLQMMSELNHGLLECGMEPKNTTAIIGPADVGDEMVLRVNLHAGPDNALVASSEKPLGVVRDLSVEIDDACDALTTLGVQSLSLAVKFNDDGQPVDVRPYEN